MADESLSTTTPNGKVSVAEVRDILWKCATRMALMTEGTLRHELIDRADGLRYALKPEVAGNGVSWMIGEINWEIDKLSERLGDGDNWDGPEITGNMAIITGILDLAESSGIHSLSFTEKASDRVLYGLVETLYDAQQEIDRALVEIDEHIAKAEKEATTIGYPPTQEIILGPDELALIGSYRQIRNEEQRRSVRDHASIFAALPHQAAA